MKVKIIESSNDKWYKNSIGYEFIVKPEMVDGMYVEIGGKEDEFLIDPEHCAIVPE